MELALGAATAAISRAGASSLAELAALRVPAVLVPYPSARGNHQFHNARALEESGAARLLEQKTATPGDLARLLVELVENTAARQTIQSALARWHRPRAAELIADIVLKAIGIKEAAPDDGRNPDPESGEPIPAFGLEVASAGDVRLEAAETVRLEA